MVRVLHTADWQIGRVFDRPDTEESVRLSDARFQTVERIAALASERKVDAVLVAGDVFDAQTLTKKTIRRLFNAMDGYRGPWILLPGNHDAALSESIWKEAQRLGVVPENVHLALEERVMLFGQIGLAVLPAPLTQRHTHRDLTEWFDNAQTPEGFVRVGLAHGSVTGVLAEDAASQNPIANDRAASASLDYLALGDWHGVKQINERTWYSGTPEPDRFRNNDSGYVLEVEIPDPGCLPKVESVKVRGYTWSLWEEEISVSTDLDLLVDRLGNLGRTDVVDLRIRGHLDFTAHQRLKHHIAEAEARAGSLKVEMHDLTVLPTDEELINLSAGGYLREVLQDLRAAQAQEPNGKYAQALLIIASMLMETGEVAQ